MWYINIYWHSRAYNMYCVYGCANNTHAYVHVRNFKITAARSKFIPIFLLYGFHSEWTRSHIHTHTVIVVTLYFFFSAEMTREEKNTTHNLRSMFLFSSSYVRSSMNVVDACVRASSVHTCAVRTLSFSF